MIGVKRQVTSNVRLAKRLPISDCRSASPSGKGSQFGFGGKFFRQLMADSRTQSPRYCQGNGLPSRCSGPWDVGAADVAHGRQVVCMAAEYPVVDIAPSQRLVVKPQTCVTLHASLIWPPINDGSRTGKLA